MHRTPIALAAIAASLILPGASLAQSATTPTTPGTTASATHVCLADALAKELGKTKAEVKAALDANRPAPGQHPTDAQKASLASALGVSVERLDALMKEYAPRGEHRAPRPPIAQIAKETGKTEAEVKAAFEANRPAPGQRPSDAQKAAVAAALGISPAQLDSLMREYGPQHGPGTDGARTAPTAGAQRS